MLITKHELVGLVACEDCLARFIKQTNNTDEPVDVVSLIGGINTISDLVWLASEKLSKKRLQRFACDCALINVELIKPYTDKYDLIVGFLKNPTKVTSHIILVTRSSAVATVFATVDVFHAARSARSAAAADGSDSAIYAAVTYAAKISPEGVNDLLRELFS